MVCLGLASPTAGGASPVPISPRWVDATALRPSILGATGTAGSGTTVVLCVLPLPQPNYLAQVPSTYCPLAGCTSLAHISSTRAGPVACGTRVVALGGVSAGGALEAGRRSGPGPWRARGAGGRRRPPPWRRVPAGARKKLIATRGAKRLRDAKRSRLLDAHDRDRVPALLVGSHAPWLPWTASPAHCVPFLQMPDFAPHAASP